jgi:hypothetical protein
VHISAEMGGHTFGPGTYTHGSAINIALANPTVTLDAGGNSSAVFIFNAGSTLTTCAKSNIVLTNGAKAENVFWFLGTALTMGADSALVGNVFAGSAITMGTNAKIMGRAIAQTAVTCETACTVEIGEPAPSDAASAASAGPFNLGDCNDFAVMAGSAATCAGTSACDIGGLLGVSPGTSVTGNFAFDIDSTPDERAGCAVDGLVAWYAGRAMTSDTGVHIPAEMGGHTFGPGTYTHGSAINIALANPTVTLDAGGNSSAVFIFNAGSTLTTCADSNIVLTGDAKAENVFWFLGTALTMGANSTLVGNVFAGSAITMGTDATILGRAIAQTAVTCETACTVEIQQNAVQP